MLLEPFSHFRAALFRQKRPGNASLRTVGELVQELPTYDLVPQEARHGPVYWIRRRSQAYTDARHPRHQRWRGVSLFGRAWSDHVDMSSSEYESRHRLDSRPEHVPDHRGQLAVRPLQEHATRQFVRPWFRIAHPTAELLSKDPLPIVLDEDIEIIQIVNGLDKVDARACSS